jgi:hypothetical protein
MLRLVTSICLILAILAGQCLCCCTGSRLLASAIDSGKDVPSSSSGCCCHRMALAQSKPTNGPSPKRETPQRPCRCRDRQAVVTAVVNPSSIAKDLRSQNYPATAEYFPVILADYSASPDLVLLTAIPPLPFLTAQDILRALHILRC